MSRGEHGNRGSGMGSKKIRRVLLAGAAVAVVAGNLVTWVGVGASAPATPPKPTTTKTVPVAASVTSVNVRSLPRPKTIKKRNFPEPRYPDTTGVVRQQLPNAPQPAVPVAGPSAPAPSPLSTFKGLDFDHWGAGWPPDTVGDVGPNHFVQAVNTSIGIFRKSDGARLAAFTYDQLWGSLETPTGTPCDANNQGDPTVVYDPMGDRWIVADFGFVYNGDFIPPFYECIAVSRTSDPVSGGWNLYAVHQDDAQLPDYPKMGIWPDGLYLT